MDRRSKLLRHDAILSEDYNLAEVEMQLVHLLSLTHNYRLGETALWNSLRRLGFNKKDFFNKRTGMQDMSAEVVLDEHFDNVFNKYVEATGLAQDEAFARIQGLWSGWNGAR